MKWCRSLWLIFMVLLLLTGCHSRADVNNAYNKGYEEGKTAGYNIGFQEGESKGFEKGHKEGYDEGYTQGIIDVNAALEVDKGHNEPEVNPNYIANTRTKKFHLPDCSSVNDIKAKNRKDWYGSREELIDEGYVPCQRCNP